MNPFFWTGLRAVCSALVLTFFLPSLSFAQGSEIESLKTMIREMEQQLQKALSRIDQLEKEKAVDTTRLGQVEQSVKAVQSAPSALNPAIGLVIDAVAEHRAKAGGNFNFRSAELGIAASIDPFARAFSFINGTKEGVEVEEATIVTTSLPWNLTARAGRLFADFGRFPRFHEHELPFVNFPLSIERMVGGESRADGVEINYLFPTPFFLRGTLGGYNKIGDLNDRVSDSKSRAWSRFTYLARLNTYFDITDNNSLELGSTLAYTPSVRLTGDPTGSDRALSGIDLTYRYQPLGSTLYQGVTVGGELFVNSERRPLELEDGSISKRRHAYGGYSYAEMKLSKEWSAGFLFDYAPSIDSPGKKTFGYSPFLTWNLSEFNRLRFQYSFLDDHVREDKADRGHQFFVQWTTVLGAHTHGFRSR